MTQKRKQDYERESHAWRRIATALVQNTITWSPWVTRQAFKPRWPEYTMRYGRTHTGEMVLHARYDTAEQSGGYVSNVGEDGKYHSIRYLTADHEVRVAVDATSCTAKC